MTVQNAIKNNNNNNNKINNNNNKLVTHAHSQPLSIY